MKVFTKQRAITALLATICLQSATAKDEYHQEFGNYTVHYNLINSTELTDQIAERYEVEKSADRALLTVSVRVDTPEGRTEDKPSQISGTVRDLVRVYDLEFEEFRDPHAVYYLAEVPAGRRTQLEFDLAIQPEQSGRVIDLEFSELVPAKPGAEVQP